MAMSSLMPGVLFKNSGLNQTHTPTEITAKPDRVKEKYRRSSINGEDWPPESPIARVYDVRNSPSKLIILNNRMDKKSHLRAQSGRYNGEERKAAPERHFRSASPPQPERHAECLNSSSPKYKPPHDTEGVESRYGNKSSPHNYLQRYPATSGHPQPSQWHHYSSQVDANRSPAARRSQSAKLPRKKNKELVPPHSFRKNKCWLQHPDMTKGQKRYIHEIASVYDMTHMKQLVQARYVQLIHREQQRDFFTPENYRSYIAYLDSCRPRPWGTEAPPSVLYRSGRKSSRGGRKSPSRQPSGNNQSAPRPLSERQKSQGEENSETKHRKSDAAKSKGQEDQTECMMYSDQENKSPSKSGSRTDTERVARVKSAKGQRPRDTKKNHEEEKKDSPQSSRSPDDESNGRRPKTSIRGRRHANEDEKYWQQNPPPAKETEPNGDGLVMTADRGLEKEEEKIQELAKKETTPRKKSSRSSRKEATAAKYEETHDLVDGDRLKTRVYHPNDVRDPGQTDRHDDTPTRSDQPTPVKASSQSPEPREEYQEAMARKKHALESEADSKQVQSGSDN